jgi:hypothetical protein
MEKKIILCKNYDDITRFDGTQDILVIFIKIIAHLLIFIEISAHQLKILKLSVHLLLFLKIICPSVDISKNISTILLITELFL